MSKSTPRPPAAPDYAAAATAQGAANQSAATAGASLSNPNIYSPYGNQTVSYANTGPNGDAQPTVTQTLTPAAQATLDAQQKVQTGEANLGLQGLQTAQDVLSKPFDPNLPNLQTSLGPSGQLSNAVTPGSLSGAPTPGGVSWGDGPGPSAQTGLDLSGIAKQDVNAGMTGQNAILSRLEPQLKQNEAATAQMLANQGITPGSEAYNNAMRTQGEQRNDLETQAALQGIGLDQSANAQGFNQAATQAGLYNSGLAQNFGQQQAAAGLYNSAQGQAYGQQFQNAQFANQNQQTTFNQGTQNAQLNNQAENQGFNQQLQGAQFGNQALQNSLAQQLELYNQPLNEITALMSGSQIQTPQFQAYQGQNVGAAPTFAATQAQGQAAQQQYANQIAQQNAQTQGLYGLAGAGLGLFGL